MPKKMPVTIPICSVCGTAMPGDEVYRGRILVCSKEACRKAVRAYGGRSATPKYIEANTVLCSRPACENYVPEGFYQPNSRFPVCSKICYTQRNWEVDSLICAYPACGKPFSSRIGYHRYCCLEDWQRHTNEIFVESHCGTFRGIYEEYLAFASLSKRSMSTQRAGLATFFQFVNEQGITNLEEVHAPTITAFLRWGETHGKPSVWNALWVISAFMKWMIALGRRKSANPVVTSYHKRTKAKRLPRPYSEEEMSYIWSLLDARGNTVVRLAVAIAEESGLRISEICNLRVSDVNTKKQQLFVRIPNKTMVEAWVPFHAKTLEYLKVWLAERDPKLRHDFLLCSPQGTPFKRCTLHDAIARVLCKTSHNHKYNEEGLDAWSTHRLRHTMATRLVAGGANSAAIMAIGRWATFSAMQGYSQVDDVVKSRGYNEAMGRAKESRARPVKATSSFRKYVNPLAALPKAS
jgi:integrase